MAVITYRLSVLFPKLLLLAAVILVSVLAYNLRCIQQITVLNQTDHTQRISAYFGKELLCTLSLPPRGKISKRFRLLRSNGLRLESKSELDANPANSSTYYVFNARNTNLEFGVRTGSIGLQRYFVR